MEQIKTFFGKQARIACDQKRYKARGINSRPKTEIDEEDPDNFWRYLFSSGIILIAFSLFYPYEKANELRLSLNQFKNDVDQIKFAIEIAEKDESFLKESMSKIEAGVKKDPETIKELQSLADKQIKTAVQIKSKSIDLKHKNSRIELLHQQYSVFWCISRMLIALGALMTIIGGWNWYCDTRRKKESQKLEEMPSRLMQARYPTSGA